MTHFKLYEEFLNEINLDYHWKEERASLDSPKSRLVMMSPGHPDGWTCRKLLHLSKNGNVKGEIWLHDFLQLTQATMEDFELTIAECLHRMLTTGFIVKKNYGPKTAEFKAAYLGKILIKVGNEYYSPVLNYSTRAGDKGGNNIWGVINNYNTGKTIVFHEDKVSPLELTDMAYRDYIWRANRGEPGYTKTMSLLDFKRQFFIDKETLNSPDHFEMELMKAPPKKEKEKKEEPIRQIMQVSDEPIGEFKSAVINDRTTIAYGVVKDNVTTTVTRKVISARPVSLEELRKINPTLIKPGYKGETRQGIYIELAGEGGRIAKVLAKFPGENLIVGTPDGRFHSIKIKQVSKRADSQFPSIEGPAEPVEI
jgi:hypothetical protein